MASTLSPDELFLIDGNSLAYRAFFALPESIATSTGVPTNAIFGFASMLVKILTDYGPKATVVVWDAGDTGRKEVYAEYKAQRRSRPDLLKEQWPHLEPLVDAFGYRNLRVDGYEADDVIASIVEKARTADPQIPVMVVTGDRDAYQLVDDGVVKIMTTSRGITDTRVYDREGVIDRYGIPPELVPDFIGLKGDTSDNIPGVPGIGDKTAAELLQRFGTLESVLDHIDDISGAKRKQNLTEHADDARRVQAARHRQARHRRRARPPGVRGGRARPLEAQGHVPQVRAARAAPPARGGARLGRRRRAGARGRAGAHRARAQRQDRGPQAPPRQGGRGRGQGAADSRGRAVRPRPRRTASGSTSTARPRCSPATLIRPEAVVEALGSRPVTAHDAKSLGQVPATLAHDTEVAAYLLEPARRAYPFRELTEERGLGTDVEDEAAADALLLHALAAWQREEIRGRGLTDLFENVELPLVRVLREMELAGSKLDTERLQEISDRVKAEADALEREIFDLCGEEFTLGSPKQLEEVLFGKLGLSRKRRGKTGYSTDARVLQAIRHEHPVIPKIERWRELTKLAQTYLDALPLLIAQDGRIHTTFNQTAATTGRLSSNNPNLQNIPIRTALGREIRACFVAEPGDLLVSADYSQVELRLLAHIAGEDALKEIFRKGEDVHTATACRVFGVTPEQIDPGMRSKAKMINYGIVYGLSAWGMADRLDIPQEEADEFIQRYLAGFPAVARWIEETITQGTEHGYVSTLFGRRRQVPELRARRWELRKQGERFAVNMVIQGTAADIMKVAMVRCDHAVKEAGLRSRMILQIHDELLFEGPAEEAEEVKRIAIEQMGGAFEMDPPLAVDAGIGPDWLAAK